jgi:hypothetical protein
MGIEQFDQLGEIDERAGQAVDLVDHHDIDPARPHFGEQRLQGRPVEGKLLAQPVAGRAADLPEGNSLRR